MCLLIVAEDKFPAYEILKAGESQNPDGNGIAYRKAGKVEFHKGITLDRIIELGANSAPPWLIHFRVATVGPACPELCHPFPVSLKAPLNTTGQVNAVVAQNGNWFNWREGLFSASKSMIGDNSLIPKDNLWSDSRALAFVTAVHGKNFLKTLPSAGKLAYMTNNLLERFGSGWVDKGDGVFCSYDPVYRFQWFNRDWSDEDLQVWCKANGYEVDW